jgi:hypothetical protein
MWRRMAQRDTGAVSALRDDGLEPRIDCGDVDHDGPADGEAEAADALRIDVVPPRDVAERGIEVATFDRAPGEGVAVALAVRAPVEEEHAVAMARQHARLGQELLAVRPPSMPQDDGRAAARRVIPAADSEPVGGRERNVLELEAVGGPARRHAGRMHRAELPANAPRRDGGQRE